MGTFHKLLEELHINGQFLQILKPRVVAIKVFGPVISRLQVILLSHDNQVLS